MPFKMFLDLILNKNSSETFFHVFFFSFVHVLVGVFRLLKRTTSIYRLRHRVMFLIHIFTFLDQDSNPGPLIFTQQELLDYSPI